MSLISLRITIGDKPQSRFSAVAAYQPLVAVLAVCSLYLDQLRVLYQTQNLDAGRGSYLPPFDGHWLTCRLVAVSGSLV